MEAEIEWTGDVDPDELAEMFRAAGDALPRHLRSAADDIGTRLMGSASSNAPVGVTSNLQAQIDYDVREVGAAGFVVAVGSNQPYVAAQEFGFEPGEVFPPWDGALERWSEIVLGDADAAFLVARKIFEEGTDAQPYLRPAFEENVEYIKERVTEAFADAFRDAGFDV